VARSAFRYVPAGRVDGHPHVMVDGAPRPGTVATLSHWPGTPTPEALWDDVSAGIVLRALARPELLARRVRTATIDHYDADGVIALALLCVDGLAAEHGPLLVEAARVGDFDVVTERRAALIAFALATLGDARRAEAACGPAPRGDVMAMCAWSATGALSVLPALAADPAGHEALWAEEARAYDAASGALARGWAVIEERPEHDLAVVRVDTTHPGAGTAAWGDAPLHRAAVHSATSCLRIATVAGDRLDLRYRYESWVRLVSRRPRPRVDLAPVAAELTRAEDGGASWVFDGASAVTGALHVAGGGPSTLDPAHFVETVCSRLDTLDAGPPAWDPYALPVRSRTTSG